MLFHPKKDYVSRFLGQWQHSTRLSRSSPKSSQKHVASVGRERTVGFTSTQAPNMTLVQKRAEGQERPEGTVRRGPTERLRKPERRAISSP